MERRRVLLLAVAVAAGITLLVLGRPGGDDPAADGGPAAVPGAGQPPAAPGGPPAAPAPAPPPAAVDPSPTGGAEPVAPVPTVLPHDESGVTDDETLAPEAAAAAVRAAEEFAARWVTPHPDWHGRLVELSTPALADALAGADPPQPARQLTGPGQILFEAPAWARVGVPADRGTLVLDVVVAQGQWLVAAVDWWPA